jgi:hypothetical protein
MRKLKSRGLSSANLLPLRLVDAVSMARRFRNINWKS